MTIIDRLYEECNTPVELWGDTVAPLQCDNAYGCYRILQWDVEKRSYEEWVTCRSAVDTLLRYYRAKCFEGELLDSDMINDQVAEFMTMVNRGDLHC